MKKIKGKQIMKKIKSLFIKIFKTKKSKIIGASVVIIVVAAIIAFSFLHNSKETVDTNFLINTLQKSSELTTAKLNYTGLSKFEDSGIAFLNRADYRMIYRATARIGINVDEVKIDSDDNNKIIYVSIPKAQVQDVKVDTTSIEFFDQKFALFNVNEKEDQNKAIALAEEEAKKEINKMGGLKMADDQSAALIKGILANAIPDGYKIEIKQQ